MPLRSRVTATSKPAICRPSASKKNTLVWPTPLPMMKARREDRMMALAILGSATSTSLMSRGRSMTTDLLRPSATDCDPISLAVTLMDCVGGSFSANSAAIARGTIHDATIRTAKLATRTDVIFVTVIPSVRSATRSQCTHPEAHRIDGALLVVVAAFRRALRVEDAAQRERNRAELLRQLKRLGLLFGQFQRRGLADHGFGPGLFVDGLVDRQDPHVS